MTTRASHSLSLAPWQGKLGLGLGNLIGKAQAGGLWWLRPPPAVSHPSQGAPEGSGAGSLYGVWVHMSALPLTSCVIWGK